MDSEIRDMFSKLSNRVLELEKRLALVSDKLGIEYVPADPDADCCKDPKLVDAIKRGDMLDAIRIYREMTKSDLATAKKEMEKLWKDYYR